MDTTCLRSNQGELVGYESHFTQIERHRDIHTIPRVTTQDPTLYIGTWGRFCGLCRVRDKKKCPRDTHYP